VIRRRAVEGEIDRELAFHLDELIREKTAAGLGLAEATHEAHREFGSLARIAEQGRDARGVSAVNGFVDDARYGLRLLLRTPGFLTVASLALAIGIGATAATVAGTALVLARPLPFPAVGRLVAIRSTAEGALFPRTVSMQVYLAWRARARTVAAIGASRGGWSVISDPGAGTFRVQHQAFTPSLFQLLGVVPEIGDIFEPLDDPSHARTDTAIISHRLWQERFGGAHGIVGRTVLVNGQPRRIIGVLPANFRFQSDAIDLWLPLIPGPARDDSPGQRVAQLMVTARLRDGVTVADARDEIAGIAAALDGGQSGPGIDVSPLRDTLYGWTRPRLLTMGAMAALLLGLACANVAALLLARGRLRRRELALRVALGASRRRIVRQLLTESLVLGGAAAIPAAGVAAFGLRAVAAALGPPPGMPRVMPVTFDGWTVAIVVSLSVLTAIVFGLVPAAVASGIRPVDGLSPNAARTRRALATTPWRGLLVGAQVMIAEVLVIAGLLLTISYVRLAGRELNFEPRGLLSFTYTLRVTDVIQPLGQEKGKPLFDISPAAAGAMQRLLTTLSEVPGAGPVAAMSIPPVNSLILPIVNVMVLDGAPVIRARQVAYVVVTPHVFRTLRTPIRQGREFDHRDARNSPWTVVVNEAMARAIAGTASPLGRRLQLDLGDDERPREIIGVVGDVPARLEQSGAQPAVYTSFLQQPRRYRGPAVGMFAGMTFVLRPDAGTDTVLAAARRAAYALTPDRPIDAVGTVDSHLYGRMAERRNYVLAVDALALLSVLLVMIGLHGVTMHEVLGRANEFAIRRSLGAKRRRIVALIAAPTLAVVAAGTIAGGAAALLASPLLAPQLWGLAANNVAIIGVSSVALLLASGLGCGAALRRALSFDTVTRLRCE
jgi:putative ABC transport system permease protein